ncbi:DUF5132 domain-containing protein [Methylocystis echinoides]|uniref:DUF5132 domain-containing protein n=1 Tax=Methylocystis echinoides TaxID=29468 RepID=UPI00342C6448
MKPWGFALGALTGAAATILLTRQGSRARPAAKAALKAAIMAYHEARTQGAELMEAAEDLFAEAKSEAAADIFAATMAGAAKRAPNGAQKAEEKPKAETPAQEAEAAAAGRAEGASP